MRLLKIILLFLLSAVGGMAATAQPAGNYCTYKQTTTHGILCAIRPSTVDANQLDAAPSGSDFGFGWHAVAVPTHPSGRVLIWITGTAGKPFLPEQQTFLHETFLTEALEEGFFVLQAAYRNDISINFGYCLPGGPDCHYMWRTLITQGSETCILRVAPCTLEAVSLSTADQDMTNSLLNRLRTLAAYLETREPRLPTALRTWPFAWHAINIGGLSQGGGHATLIASDIQAVRRVCLIAATENSSWLPAPLDGTNKTIKENFYGLVSDEDSLVAVFTASWTTLGIPVGNQVIVDDPPGTNGHTTIISNPSWSLQRRQACYQ